MKKIVLMLMVFMFGFMLTACQETDKPINYQNLLVDAGASITLPTETESNLDLISYLDYQDLEIMVTWFTSNANLVDVTGQVFRPTFIQGDQTVRLTALLQYETFQWSLTFDILVKALEEDVYYTVTFESNGGSTLFPLQVKENNLLTEPTAPTKAGFEFVGWYDSSSLTTLFDFNTPITADITIYAAYLEVETTLTELKIFYLNDLHGSIERKDSELGLAYIANYINYHRQQNPGGVILLAGGDMLQGSALSNYYQGLSTIEIMNAMGFDAMVLGNHEFDWGIEVVTNYFDGNLENGEANFPLLAANAFYQGTEDLIEHIDPYTIIERGDIKVGVIGTIGYGLESSIAYSRVEGFVFASPTQYIEELSTHLRVNEGVDYVFVLSHDVGDLNYTVAGLTGDARVDIIFNAHSHSRYTQVINGVTVIQSSSNGKYVGTITINLSNNEITAKNEAASSLLTKADATVLELINYYKAETDDLFNTPIIRSGAYASQTHISNWLAELMLIKTGADIAFHNYGGTRTNINDGEDITLGKLYQIFPFDNTIKMVKLTGAQINYFKNLGNATASRYDNFDSNTYYWVATNDYLFDKPEYPFVTGIDPVFDGTLLRDMVEDELKLQALVYNNFTVQNTILTNPKVLVYNSYSYFKIFTY